MSAGFGSLLSYYVKAAGLSLRGFARIVKCSPTLPGLVARGQRRPPLDLINAWADALKLTGSDRDRFLELAILAHLSPDLKRWIEKRWR